MQMSTNLAQITHEVNQAIKMAEWEMLIDRGHFTFGEGGTDASKCHLTLVCWPDTGREEESNAIKSLIELVESKGYYQNDRYKSDHVLESYILCIDFYEDYEL